MTIQQKSLRYQPYIDWIIGEHEKQKTLDCFEFVGQEFIVKPTVFNPNIATSSKVFAEEILKLDLKGKRVLDAGCGSGILSIAALKAGADFVYAFDINEAAVETTRENLNRLGLSSTYFQVEQNDRLPEMPTYSDYIFFNPPFFDAPVDRQWKRSVCDPGKAFFCNVITNLKKVLRPKGKLVMIVGGELETEYVKAILSKNSFLKIEAQNFGVKNHLNLDLITAQLEKIVD